jgi:hypothetical protein
LRVPERAPIAARDAKEQHVLALDRRRDSVQALNDAHCLESLF